MEGQEDNSNFKVLDLVSEFDSRRHRPHRLMVTSFIWPMATQTFIEDNNQWSHILRRISTMCEGPLECVLTHLCQNNNTQSSSTLWGTGQEKRKEDRMHCPFISAVMWLFMDFLFYSALELSQADACGDIVNSYTLHNTVEDVFSIF